MQLRKWIHTARFPDYPAASPVTVCTVEAWSLQWDTGPAGVAQGWSSTGFMSVPYFQARETIPEHRFCPLSFLVSLFFHFYVPTPLPVLFPFKIQSEHRRGSTMSCDRCTRWTTGKFPSLRSSVVHGAANLPDAASRWLIWITGGPDGERGGRGTSRGGARGSNPDSGPAQLLFSTPLSFRWRVRDEDSIFVD